MVEVELPSWLKALPQAPEFHPTEAEFADPIAYILKIEEESKQYGICKIIPPFTKASKKVVVNNLNRSLSLSSGTLSGTKAHGSYGPLSRSMGGVMNGPQLAKPKGLVLDASCSEPGNKAKFATRRQQLGWNPKRARGAHSQSHKLVWQSGESYTLEQFEAKAKIFARTRLGTCKDVSPLSVETLFWRAAADKPISIEYANDIPGSAFAESADSFSLTPVRLKKRKRALEDADHKNLDSIFTESRNEEKFQEEEVEAAVEESEPSDAVKSKNGGLEAGGDNAGGAGSKLANSAWNMRNVARSQGSLLRFMPEEVPGVTSPMVYIGMLFSWFAWHVEDHELHSLNYLHTGACKTWYAVPGDAAPALEEAIRVHGYGGHLNPRAAFSLLGEKTTVMSPEVLVAAGVPCCRLVQNAGEYVVTFPRAYHLGFSHGFNCGEAANFATPGWLAVAKEAAARRAAMNYLPMLSHQQLLYLLSMSLPPRMPASTPTHSRSSRLKVRKKSLGEEMVKSMFLHDVVQNNRLLRILLDNGVSRCVLAKDAVHDISTMTMFEDSNNTSVVPPVEATESSVQVQSCTQGGEATDFSSQGISSVEKAEDDHCQSRPPSCPPILSASHNEVLEDLSTGKCGEIKISCQSTDPSVSSVMPAKEQAPHDVEANPVHLKNHKVTSLAIDWGTLPCAACGILCYATMAVVEPTVTAAMTFKPIYAAAGLGHCAFEAEDASRLTTSLPAFSSPRSVTVVEASHTNKVLSSFQPTHTNGTIKQGEQRNTLAELMDSNPRPPGMEGLVAGQLQSREQGCLLAHPSTKFSEEVQGSVVTSPTNNYDGNQVTRHLGHINSQISDSGLEMDMELGTVTALVNNEHKPSLANNGIHSLLEKPEDSTQGKQEVCIVVVMNCSADRETSTSDAKVLQSGNQDGNFACGDGEEAYQTPPVSHALSIPPLQFSHINDSNCVRIEDFRDAAEMQQQQSVISLEEHEKSNDPGISSLQLLASNYDDSSDLENENTDGCDPLMEDKIIGDDDAERGDVDAKGGEVLAKPHSGVGDLLSDLVGLSADVPWLSLVPVTETANLPPPIMNSPLFTFSDLVEGPKSLEQVFISGGFCFVEEAASLGSSLTEEQFGKQSTEVTSFDGDVNNPSSSVQSADYRKVLDMQELYHRINSQALTVDSDGDEQFLIDFGLRPPKADIPQGALHMESKSMSTGQGDSLHQLEPKNNPEAGKTVTSCAPSYTRLEEENPSTSSPPITMGLAIKNPSTTGSVSRLNEEISLGAKSSITSSLDGMNCTQMKDGLKETGPHILPERKQAALRACKSVSRPRVLCLEHAVEAQQQLRSVGGAHVLIVCHSDFENYELRAKHLTQEFGIEHTWSHLPFSEGEDDEVSMVSTAVAVEDDDNRRVNDWVMQMGLFVHHRFGERESESSDDTQNLTEENFRAGPFSKGRPGKPGGSRLMAGRLGLSHKTDGHPTSYSGSSSKITARDSRRLPKMSKKKKCMVAGRWCGRVWRVSQVHPFLGGCRKMDPSLQLGMSSTSLYALSMMSDCDGGKYRRGISSSRIEASPNGFIIPVKSIEDQQSIAVRNRGRKRKAVEHGRHIQPDNGSERQKMASMCTDYPENTPAVCTVGLQNGDSSSSPKRGILTESANDSKQVDFTINGGEEVFTGGDQQVQCTMEVFSPCSHQADPAVQTSETNFNSTSVHQIFTPIPLAARDPSVMAEKNNGLENENKEPRGKYGVLDKQLPAAVLVGGNECCGSTDEMKTVMPLPLPLPSESHQVADVKGFELNIVPLPLSLSSIQIEPRRQEVGGWQKTASLTNVYSSLPLIGGAMKSNNGIKKSPVASSNATVGNKIVDIGNTASCVWRDVPLSCAPSFQRITTPVSGQSAIQFTHPFPVSNHSHVYIPYISTTIRETVSDHILVSQSSPDELYSGTSMTLASFEQEEAKLQGSHLMQGRNAGEILESGTDEANPGQESQKVSTKCSTGKPLLYTEGGIQHLGTSNLMGVKSKREIPTPVYVDDNSMEAGVPSMLDRVTGSHLLATAENCQEGLSECPDHDLAGGNSSQLVRESGILQQNLQDIKNVIRLPDSRGLFTTSELTGELASASHVHVCRTEEGQSTSDDPAVQDAHLQNCHLYDKKSIVLTPVLSIPLSLMESAHQRALMGSGELGFEDATGQDSALQHPLGSPLPLRTSSRGRSAVKARGKRPKHVGWTNYKPPHPEIPGEISANTWVHKPDRHAGLSSVFTLQPEECVEARFEGEDCDRVLEILDQSVSPTSPIPSMGLQDLTADDNESEEEKGKPEKVVKPKKKGKPKKKRAVPRKPVQEDGEFQCDLDGCRMSFGTEAELQLHKRNRCTFKGCGKGFFMHKYLLQHRRVHLDERPLKCPWKGCKQAFKWAWARTEHIRVHTGERPYLCPDCDQTFRFVSDFSRHKRNTGHTKS